MGTSGVIRHGLSPNNIEKKHYQVNNLRHNLTLKRIKTPKKILDTFDKYDQKNYRTKKKWLSDELKVLILAERTRKRSAPGKFYKQFNIFLILTKKMYFLF